MTKLLLRMSDKQIGKPIASKIILSLGLPLNILNVNVTHKGGEVLVEVPSKDIERVIQAFEENNVNVILRKGINVDMEKCINCGACFSLCPVDAISFNGDYLVVFDEEKCISCGLCVDTCPTRALKI